MANHVLEMNNLTRHFKIGSLLFGTKMTAVDKVNIRLPGDKPQIMSIVGESGSGKTTLAKMILRLLEPSTGEIKINGIPISYYSRGKKRIEFLQKVQPIFQNPFTAFSMRKAVDTYLFETALNLHIAKTKAEAKRVISNVLKSVGLQFDQIAGKYPNQFSGGELQRISIARALIPKPSLIVADEPVAMIDASLRMNIVNLFKKLKEEYKVNFVYITHDLSTAYYVSDYIATMYRGNVIEFGDAKQILNHPAHPYTELLLDSIPRVGKKWDDTMILPDLENKEYALTGCKFANRCVYAKEICRSSEPYTVHMDVEHEVLCFKHNEYKKDLLKDSVAQKKRNKSKSDSGHHHASR